MHNFNHLDRKSLAPECAGCDKRTTMIWDKTGAPVPVCKIYLVPKIWWDRGGCPFNVEVAVKNRDKVRVGQQKQSGKKARRKK